MLNFSACFDIDKPGQKLFYLNRVVSRKREPSVFAQWGGVPCNYSALKEEKSCSDAYDDVPVFFFKFDFKRIFFKALL